MIEPTRMAVFETCPSQTRNPGKMEIFKQNILGKWKFQPISHWKNGNFRQKHLEKVEILAVFTLEKWKFWSQKAWKNGKFWQKYLGKVEILSEICIEKWKF